MPARFEVKDVFQITGRGRVATGTILEGAVRVGMWVAVAGGSGALPPLRVTSVEFADNVSTRESWIALVFRNAPPMDELRRLLPEGSILEEAEGPAGSEPGGRASRPPVT